MVIGVLRGVYDEGAEERRELYNRKVGSYKND